MNKQEDQSCVAFVETWNCCVWREELGTNGQKERSPNSSIQGLTAVVYMLALQARANMIFIFIPGIKSR